VTVAVTVTVAASCVCVCVSGSLWLWFTVSMWQDIDDALHVRALPNGNFEVGVHIADVGHFVIHNSAMDKEAADRSNTTYLVDRRLDMLPVRRPSPLPSSCLTRPLSALRVCLWCLQGLLTENLCSLKPRVRRPRCRSCGEATCSSRDVTLCRWTDSRSRCCGR
jgi:hypothetical protein